MSNIPRKEYPRPQFVRENWINLNGTWAFEIDNGRSGEARGLQKVGTALSGEITVPFCPESELSGVQHTDFMYGVWYKRTVTVTEKQLKGRAVLHFGAVDYCAKVFVNGELAGNCSLASQGDKRRTKHRCCVSIALYEKYCNLGLGRILLSTLLELAKQCGYTQAELGVIEGNERAKHVYESLGFKEYGFLPNAMHYKDGATRGEYFMVKEL